MTIKQAMKKRATAEQQLRHASAQVDQAIRAEREAGKTIPQLMKITGLSYRGVYLALNRNTQKRS